MINDEINYENPYEVIAEIQDRLKSSKSNARDLSDDYDTLGQIIEDSYDGMEPLDSALSTFMEAMKSPKNDEFSLADAYRNLNNAAYNIGSERSDLANQAIAAIKESLNSQKSETNLADLAYEAIDNLEGAKPDPNEIIDEFQKSSVDDEFQLVDLYRALSDISKNKPELLDSKFGIFMKALKSPKNGTKSLSVASETLDNILKAKPELDTPLVNMLSKSLESAQVQRTVSERFTRCQDKIAAKKTANEAVTNSSDNNKRSVSRAVLAKSTERE